MLDCAYHYDCKPKRTSLYIHKNLFPIQQNYFILHQTCNFRHKYSSTHFILPVVIYSFSYNFPKFFEFTVTCPPGSHMSGANLTSLNEMDDNDNYNRSDVSQKIENNTQSPFNYSLENYCSLNDLQMAANPIR